MARLATGGATVIGLGAVRVPYCQTVEAEIYGAKVNDGRHRNPARKGRVPSFENE